MKRLMLISFLPFFLASMLASCAKSKDHKHEGIEDVQQVADVIKGKGEEKPADEVPGDAKPIDEKSADPKPAEEKPAEDKDSQVNPMLTSEDFRKSLIGDWRECQDTSHKSAMGFMIYSSRLWEFTFDADRKNVFYINTEDYVGLNCSGQQSAHEGFTLHYLVGKNQGSNTFDFDLIVLDNIDQEILTLYSSARMSSGQLQISLGALNGDGTLGDGNEAVSRFVFPKVHDGVKNLNAYFLTRKP